MRCWKKVLISILIFILLLLGGLTFFISTTSGLHLLLNTAARWVPGLDIRQIEGDWRNLKIKGIHYEKLGIRLNAGEFHLALELGCLRKSAFCINDLSLKDVNLVVDSTKIPSGNLSKPERRSSIDDLSTPYPITLRGLTLENINVQIDNTTSSLSSFSSGMVWQGRTLTLTPTHIQRLQVALPASPQATNQQHNTAPPQKDQKPLTESLQEIFAKPLLTVWPDFQLPLDIKVQDILGEQLRITGMGELDINRLRIKAKNEKHQLYLETFDVDLPQGKLSAKGQAGLADDWPLDFTVTSRLNSASIKEQNITLRLKGKLREKLKLALNLSGSLQAQLDMQTELARVGLPFEITLNSSQLSWPLTGSIQYQANDFHFHANGKITDYVVLMQTTFKGTDIPPMNVNLDAKGNITQFTVNKLRLAALQGYADLIATVDWRKALNWRSEIQLSDIDTAKQYPNWSTKLSGNMTTRGSLHGGRWQIHVPQLMLRGHVKQNALKVDGSFYGNSDKRWNIPAITMELGRNNVSIKGTIDEKLNLDAEINAPQLDNTLPTLGGQVKGNIKLHGTLKTPYLLTNLTAHRLRWQSFSLGRLKLSGNVHSSEQMAGNLDIQVTQLQQGSLKVDQLTLIAEGSEKQHQLKLNMQGEPVSGQLALEGSFNRDTQQWKGLLDNTRFTTPIGQWHLSQKMSIDYLNSQRIAKVEPHCWQHPHAELCIAETMEIGSVGHAHIVLNRLDLAMIKPLLTDKTQLQGVFNGNAEIRWNADNPLPEGKLSLKGKKVKVTQEMGDNKLPVAFDTLNLTATLDKGRAQLGWLIDIANNGQLAGNVQIADPQTRRLLSGDIRINKLSLAAFNPVFDQKAKMAGLVDTNLKLAGNTKHPKIFGQLKINDINIDGDFMPVQLTRSYLTMQLNGARSTLEGVIKTTKGQINLNGNTDWSRLNNWRAQLTAKGEKVRVTVPPMVQMDVSPHIVFRATPTLLKLDGRLDIPWANITVQKIPENMVEVSPDEVMLDKKLQPIKQKSTTIPINSNLLIHIGNDVHLDAYGLKASLEGDLKLVQDKYGLGLNGQINIPFGHFRAYGQDLIVRKGQLHFSGSPDQPYLNLEAIRNPEATENKVTVGLRVMGLVDGPKVDIFSEPTLSQQEALSYLLRGQALNFDGDSNALTSALIGLGVAQSGHIMGKIGETFGISHLALDTTGVGNNQQVQLSGYVLPRLQVKYGIGIFDSLAILTLRYRLMPKLYLEAVSGANQALDMLYQFEF